MEQKKLDLVKLLEQRPPKEKKYRPPVVGTPMTDCVIEGVTTEPETIAILSYLGYRPLVAVTMSSRYAFNFTMERKTRKKILCWKPTDNESSCLGTYINGVIQKMAASKAAALNSPKKDEVREESSKDAKEEDDKDKVAAEEYLRQPKEDD